MLPFVAFYRAAIVGSGAGSVRRRILGLPAVLALGLGMAASQTRAVVDGAFGSIGTFARTPKSGGAQRVVYFTATRGLVGVELALAVYLLAACGYALAHLYLGSLPFLALFAVGFGAVGGSSLRSPRSPWSNRENPANKATAGGHTTHHSHGASAQVPVAGSNASSTR